MLDLGIGLETLMIGLTWRHVEKHGGMRNAEMG
jgi:hypothetical protein